jgi:hypothetical protein
MEGMPPRFRRLSLASASVCVLILALAACGSAAAPKPAATAAATFAGYKWSVVAIDHDGKHTLVPARYSVYLAFTPNGEFGANDPVNFHSGTYRPAEGGFTTSDVATTLVGYMGNDPVTLLAIGAIASFDQPAHATVRSLTGNGLAVAVNGYTLICQRDGKQANFPPAKPT